MSDSEDQKVDESEDQVSESNEVVEITLEQLLTGGDIIRIEVPEITFGGKLGVVYMKHPKTGDILNLSKSRDKSERVIEIVAKNLCFSDGSPMFSKDTLKRANELPVPIFGRASRVITQLANLNQEEAKKVSESLQQPDSPIN